jgi:hypothetical protein
MSRGETREVYDPVIADLVDGIADRCTRLCAQYAPLVEDAPAGPAP